MTAILLAILHVAASVAAPHPAYTLRKNVAYGKRKEQKLDLYLPKGGKQNRAAFVVIHGGGFDKGDKAVPEVAEPSARLAAEGYVVASVNYRFTPPYRYPAPVEDVQLAVRWLRSHGKKFGVPPDRICSMGFSAGAYLAVFLGELHQALPGQEAAQLPGESPAANCVVGVAGPYDLVLQIKLHKDDAAAGLLGKDADEEATRKASPLYHVDADTAPAALIQGEKDPLVSPDNTRELEKKLRENGVPVKVIFHGGRHVFGGLTVPQRIDLTREAVTWVLEQAGKKTSSPSSR